MIRPPSKEICALVIGLSILTGGLLSSRYLRPSQEITRLTLDKSYHDFGKSRQGQTLVHAFRMTNGGKKPIKIVKVESSCSCTTTNDIADRVIQPNQTVDLPVSIQTGPGDGHESGRITLYYNSLAQADPKTYFAVASVVTDVDPDYRIRPTLLDFGTVASFEPVSRIVRIRPERMADVSVVKLSSSKKAFSTRQVATPVGEQDLYVEVVFSGYHLWRSEALEAAITIDTTSLGNKSTQILARVHFIAPVQVEPMSVIVGSQEVGTVVREIKFDSIQPIRIKALKSDDPAIRLATVGPLEGKALQVQASIDGSNPYHPINSKVSIDLEPSKGTDATGARTVTIPIHRLTSKF